MRRKLNLLVAVAALLALSACAGTVGERGNGGDPGSRSTAPSITAQPAGETVGVGQTATFTVTATGNPTPTYQWQNAVTGANIAGATSASYTTPATTLAESGSKFQVVVSNSAGSITSTAATLTVDAAPGFTTQPASLTVTAGQPATFTVVATGSAPLSYQWQRGTTNITGATSSSYTLAAASASDNGATFRVVVTNPVSNATSNSATLTVDSGPVITAQPANKTVLVGQTATFTVTATGSPAPTYQWQNAATSANISGATSASYTTPATTLAESGSKFQVVVSNSAGSITSTAATLTVDAAPGFTMQPASLTVTAGQPATFTVVATGAAPLSYQWQRGTTNITGATSSSYTLAAASASDNGATFRVVVTDPVGNATSNSATLTVDSGPAITTQPANQTVLVGQTATFTVAATGNPAPTYQWQNAATSANISGATSASYTTPATTLADSGSTFQVVITNSVSSVTSNAATLTVNATGPPPTNAQVLTYHNDTMRTGLNPNETILTTSNVNSTSFGKLGSLTVTGLVDAEPLYVPNLTVNSAKHNVVFVVTEHDMAYAFDADTPGPPLWQVSLIPGTETTSDDRGCGQVEPEIGITSTPVIDLSAGPNGTMFVVTMSKDSSNNYHQRLHAVDLTTGADLITPTEVQATYPGSGTGSSSGTQTFNPGSYEERSALLLANGIIYTTWTSHCDAPNYTSWVISYNESTLQQTAVLNLTANGNTQGGREGGIWNAGSGPSVDASGSIYVLIGNGTFDTTLDGNGFPNAKDFGNSFVRLSVSGGTLSVADYFAMDNPDGGDAESESSADTDFGSGGAMLLPDLQDGQGNTWHLGVGAGKDGHMYIVDRDNMGKFTASDANIYQEITGAIGGVWSAPAYFNNAVYYGPVGQSLRAFTITSAKFATSASSWSATTFGYPGTTPSISSNGTSNGIVWALQNGSTGTLHAYDATNLATELYNSNQAAGNRDQFATNSNCKFVTPMIANGKVYVGTPGAVIVFGLLSP
ncbi:MAG TPA: immunoglobulin domain-containing protein [Candidatus Baltobacteraceae bacterium]|nr:immunoglobulin domain-containing protein [Candidatus Baltobacteraceae bacterium]